MKHANNHYILDEISKKLTDVIISKMQTLGYTQKKLAELSNISQPTISKLLSRDSCYTLNQLITLSNVLNTNLLAIVASASQLATYASDGLLSSYHIKENDNLVLDTSRPAFKGYIANKYYTYFRSTISSEEKIIEGELEFISEANNNCSARLILYTGKIDISGNRVTKQYFGNVIISIQMATCYCILFNQQSGEFCFFSFHHMFLSDENLHCRTGAVLTTSSGENKRPTLHRIIFSERKFDTGNEKDLLFLKGQLCMNSRKIIIEENVLQQLIKEYPDLETLLQTINIDSCKKSVYSINENQLLTSALDIDKKIECINRLRVNGHHENYNRISSKTDEYLFQYYQHMGNDH